jgi:hypothetical protein
VRGQCLRSGQALSNGYFTLTLQTDGNLVLWGPSEQLWASNTRGSGATEAVLQSDGNFVLYGATFPAIWHTHTNGTDAQILGLNNDGTVNLFDSAGNVLWNPAPAQPAQWCAAPSFPSATLTNNQCLKVNQHLTSNNGLYTLWMQSDGNLVLYGPSGAVWATNTAGQMVSQAVLDGAGNLLLQPSSGHPLWASKTSGAKVLVLNNDGTLSLINGAFSIIWRAP